MIGPSIKDMIDAGVHFGHRSKYWNPKMEPYIYTTHKKLHILNLEKSSEYLSAAAKYIQGLAASNGKIMFIGTKRAASDIVKKYSDLTSMPYVNNRWLGGLLTNFNTVKQSIAKLEDLRNRFKNQKIYNLSKKQAIDLKRNIETIISKLNVMKYLMSSSLNFFVPVATTKSHPDTGGFARPTLCECGNLLESRLSWTPTSAACNAAAIEFAATAPTIAIFFDTSSESFTAMV